MNIFPLQYVEGKLSQDATSNSSPTPSPKSDCSCSQQAAAPEPLTSSDNNDSKATEAVKNIVEELNALPQPGDTTYRKVQKKAWGTIDSWQASEPFGLIILEM